MDSLPTKEELKVLLKEDEENGLVEVFKTNDIGYEIKYDYDKVNEGKLIEELNYINLKESILYNEVLIYNKGKLVHNIKNSIKVKLDSSVDLSEGIHLDDITLYSIGNKQMEDLSDYMVKMFHPKYKSYKQLIDYLG